MTQDFEKAQNDKFEFKRKLEEMERSATANENNAKEAEQA